MGWGIIPTLYSIEWYSRINCPNMVSCSLSLSMDPFSNLLTCSESKLVRCIRSSNVYLCQAINTHWRPLAHLDVDPFLLIAIEYNLPFDRSSVYSKKADKIKKTRWSAICLHNEIVLRWHFVAGHLEPFRVNNCRITQGLFMSLGGASAHGVSRDYVCGEWGENVYKQSLEKGDKKVDWSVENWVGGGTKWRTNQVGGGGICFALNHSRINWKNKHLEWWRWKGMFKQV